jgi:small-conductance mechanosensitive channel
VDTPLATVSPVLPAIAPEREVSVCGDDPGFACTSVLEWTDNDIAARAADWLVARPAKIVLILLLGYLLGRLTQRLISRFVLRVGDESSLLVTGPLGDRARQRTETIGLVMRSISKAVIWVIVLLMVLGELGINLGPILAGAGIVGVAIGFGSQTLVRDFLSGMFMLIEDQFGVGDIVDLGEASGVVEGISLRTTRLRAVDGTVWHVPNGEVRRVGNKSQDWSRALLDVEVAYETDVARASELIKLTADAIREDPDFGTSILDEPEVWGVEYVGNGRVQIRIVVRTRPSDQWRVMRELRRRIKQSFDEHGINAAPPVWGPPPGAG